MKELEKLLTKVKEYIEFLKTHSFGNRLMRKRTISTLEKLIIYAGVALFSFIIALFVVIIPGIQNFKTYQAEKTEIMNKIYGKAGEEQGVLYLSERKKKELQEQETIFRETRKQELEKYDHALLKDDNIYNVVVFLEDYAVTLHTEEKPIVVSNVAFGNMEEVTIPVNQLKQKTEEKISIPAEYRVLPITVSLEAHREKVEQFLDFVYHSGDIESYYFKGNPVPVMSVESINLPVKREENEEKDVSSYAIKMNIYFQKAEKLQQKPS